MLLAIRGLPESAFATIHTLAERMALKHHSAVELIDRLESHGLVRGSRGRGDHHTRGTQRRSTKINANKPAD